MKKLLVFIAFIACCNVTFAQSGLEKKTEYFADAAAKEFNLDKKQQKKLSKARLTYHEEYADVVKQEKKGNITVEEKKSKLSELNLGFKKVMEDTTEKTNAELQPFYKRMREELKKIW